MKHPDQAEIVLNHHIQPTRLGFYTLLLVVGWTCAIITSLLWNLHLQEQAAREVALNVARTYLENDDRYRRWNALHGGVYLPLSPERAQDVYSFSLPESQVVTPSGRVLTLTDHAYMMREVYKLPGMESPVQGRIVSLDPISPQNVADPWENKALNSLAEGGSEVMAVTEMHGEEHLRLMRPFILEKPCLKCHGQHGYELGDMRGGISVRVPMAFFRRTHLREQRGAILGHVVWWLLGLGGIFFSYSALKRRIYGRIRAEEALEKLQRQQDRILTAAGEGIYGVDRDGITTFVNPAAADMLGWPAEELVGRHQHEVVHYARSDGSHYPVEECPIHNSVREGVVYQGADEFYWRRDGEGFPIEYISTPIVEKGEVVGAVVTFSDITDRLQSEERHIQTEKIMSVVSLVEGMAHELNNPLGGIMQGAQSVLRRVSTDLPRNAEVASQCGVDLDKVREYLEKRQILRFLAGIRSSAERAAHIVSYMLQFSRPFEAGGEPGNAALLLEKGLELARTPAKGEKGTGVDLEGLEIVRDFAEEVPKIPCSVAEIEQVLMNLIRNSAEALSSNPPTEGRPRIYLRSRYERDSNSARLEVEDNGPGMTVEVQRRVFEPFFTTKPPGEGTGLGLAVSYFIVTVGHQGSLELSSTPGRGTLFTIRLPLGRRSPFHAVENEQ